MDKKKNMLGNVTFEGDVTFHGPMFDIHDNDKVFISTDNPKDYVDENDGSSTSEAAEPCTTILPQDNENVNGEEIFRFIHPARDEYEEAKIDKEVKRLVTNHGIQEICQYLYKMSVDEKILLPQNPSTAYKELTRMGMPDGDGYNLKTFQKYYKR